MKDIQNLPAEIPLFINKVGVKNIEFPLKLFVKNKEPISVHAVISLFASLSKDFKGTNMSRFIEHLMEYDGKEIVPEDFQKILESLSKKVQSDNVYITAKFKYPHYVLSPVTKKKSIYYSTCVFKFELLDKKYFFTTEVNVTGTALCPCSKEISEFGAHNQRSIVNVSLRQLEPKNTLWLEDLVEVVQSCFSCRIYPLLKRPDEKYVTEFAFSHPKFVEDISREVVNKLILKYKDSNITSGSVTVENLESIHLHDAYSEINFEIN